MVNREEAIEKILEALREGKPEYVAAQEGGIVFKTWWQWRQEMPGLTERAAQAKRGRVILYEDALHKAALKGSVTACMVLLRKESKEWRELIDGSIAPMNPGVQALGEAAAAGAAAIINMLSAEKKLRIKAAMSREGLLELPPPGINGNGSNGNGHGPGH